MNLSPYVQTVRDGVTQAAALADDHTRDVAERLGGSLEASTRLALIAALSDAAGTISAELAPASVEVRMAGQDPEFHVSVPRGQAEPTVLYPPEEAEADTVERPLEDGPLDDEDEPVARVSLRLPASVKAKVDEVAAADGISTNAWLTRAVLDALADADGGATWPRSPRGPRPPRPPAPPAPPVPPGPPAPGGFFGAGGPFGPHGVFGPHGPFGPHGVFGRDERGGRDADDRRHRHGRVQGWVR